MRTTLDIADDVLYAVRELSRREKKSLGQVMSELARQAFAQQAAPGNVARADPLTGPAAVLGIRPLPSRGGVVSPEQIDRLLDDEAP
jgi:hypothetical protein